MLPYFLSKTVFYVPWRTAPLSPLPGDTGGKILTETDDFGRPVSFDCNGERLPTVEQ